MAKVSVEIDLSGVREKLSDANMQRGRYALANQALSDMNQYVPMDEGILRMSASIDIDGKAVNYNTPYAKAQFYGTFSNYTTPGTGPRWDEKAKGNHVKDWEKAFLKGADL